MSDHGPQKQPNSVGKVMAETKQVSRQYTELLGSMLAERDPTPVTAEWLDTVMGPSRGMIKYFYWEQGGIRLLHDAFGTFELQVARNTLIVNPTRGDVLTALRLLGQRGER